MHKEIEKEWNGGAIVSLIYIVIYTLTLILLDTLPFFVINGSTVLFQFFLGLVGMFFAFKNFREKKYGKGALIYFISLIPSLFWVLDGLFVAVFLSIFVIATLLKNKPVTKISTSKV